MDSYLSRRVQAGTLAKELYQVLGQYTPAGDATVFVHAGAAAEFVALHETAHKDLVANTAYGWLLQFLISGDCADLKGGEGIAKPMVLAETMIGGAWNVLEGHATWTELLHMRERRGVSRALDERSRLPDTYRAALDAFAADALLKREAPAVYDLLLITAMAEYAMDRTIAALAGSADSFAALFDFPAGYPSCPDADLERVYAVAGHLASTGRLGELFDSVALEGLTDGQSPQQLAANGRLLRAAVEQIKSNLHGCDPEGKILQCDLFTSRGLRGFFHRLDGDRFAPAESSAPLAGLVNDGVAVRNDPATPITTRRDEVALSELPLGANAALSLDPEDVLVCSSGEVYHELFEQMMTPLTDAAREELMESIAGQGYLRMEDGAANYSLEVFVAGYSDVAATGARRLDVKRHYLAYGTAADNQSYLGAVSAALPGRCCWLGNVSMSTTGLRAPDLSAVPMPCVLQVGRYGHDAFMHIAGAIGHADYYTQVELGNGFHAVLTGTTAGPAYLLIGPGAASEADRYASLVGQSATDAPDVPELLLRPALAAVWVAFRATYEN